MDSTVSEAVLQQFSEFLVSHLGLFYPCERGGDLVRSMGMLAQETQFNGPEACMRWFMSSALTRQQTEMLASHLSVGETYFFREPAVFDALERTILPQLINRRRNANNKRLRIWSAGCCTGEEAYSIAILLHRLLPDIDEWNISILGTDINPAFLKKARHGCYREWSFRNVPTWIKQAYFDISGLDNYILREPIKKLVQFDYLNLVDDVYPSLDNNTNAMDIIFCRNVLMYFEPKKSAEVVQKLYRALLRKSWLIVSAAEVGRGQYARFSSVNFRDAILYCKTNKNLCAEPDLYRADWQAHETVLFASDAMAESEVVAWLQAQPERADTLDSYTVDCIGDDVIASVQLSAAAVVDAEPDKDFYEVSLAHYKSGDYEQAVCVLQKNGATDPKCLALLARIYANQGNLVQALVFCEAAIGLDKCNPGLYYLLGIVLEEQGQPDSAVAALKKALYLDHKFTLAYFAMGGLYQHLGKATEAAKCFANTADLLGNYAESDELPDAEGMTAGRLVEIVRARERMV